MPRWGLSHAQMVQVYEHKWCCTEVQFHDSCLHVHEVQWDRRKKGAFQGKIIESPSGLEIIRGREVALRSKVGIIRREMCQVDDRSQRG